MDNNVKASVGDEQSDSDESMHDEEQHEGEWGGISGEQAAAEATVTTYEHRTGTKPKKPPTGHELRAIKDATDLFKSSSFKFQV